MNPANCSDGWATDDVFDFFATPPAPCSVPIAAYVVPFVVLLALRASVGAVLWAQWIARRHGALREKRTRTCPGFPLSAVLTTLYVTTFFLTLVLTSLDVATAQNGASQALLGAIFLTFGACSSLTLLRYVRLSHRLLPLSATLVDSASNASGGVVVVVPHTNLRRFDTLQIVLACVQVACMVGLVVFAEVLNFALPEQAQRWFQGTWACFTLHCAAYGTSLVRQLWRCQNAATALSADMTSTQAPSSPVQRAIARIRRMRDAMGAIFVVSTLLYALCAAGVIRSCFELVMLLALDDVGTGFAVAAHWRWCRGRGGRRGGGGGEGATGERASKRAGPVVAARPADV